MYKFQSFRIPNVMSNVYNHVIDIVILLMKREEVFEGGVTYLKQLNS